jgi:4-hydroxybutyryl-CoA dehydratase/vinylacetyl-CoA-Delta-isomerase
MVQRQYSTARTGTLMSGAEYRESLRRYRPRVYVDGQLIAEVADAPGSAAGDQRARGKLRFRARSSEIDADECRADEQLAGRSIACCISTKSAGDLLNKLEAVRVLCQETGCAQRYLAHDALNAIHQVSARIDDARGSNEHRARFASYLQRRAGRGSVARNRHDRRQG